MTFLHREVFAKAEYFSRVRVLMRQGQAVWYPRTFSLPLLLKYGSCTAAWRRFTFTALFLSFSLCSQRGYCPVSFCGTAVMMSTTTEVPNREGPQYVGSPSLSPGEACFMIQACRHSFVRQLEMHICKWRKPSAKRGYTALPSTTCAAGVA